jgi:hypothetical protein
MRLLWQVSGETNIKRNLQKRTPRQPSVGVVGDNVQTRREAEGKDVTTHPRRNLGREIERHKAELTGRQLRVTVKQEKTAVTPVAAPKRPSALGKYAFVAGGSEEFAEEKQAEENTKFAKTNSLVWDL